MKRQKPVTGLIWAYIPYSARRGRDPGDGSRGDGAAVNPGSLDGATGA